MDRQEKVRQHSINKRKTGEYKINWLFNEYKEK